VAVRCAPALEGAFAGAVEVLGGLVEVVGEAGAGPVRAGVGA